MLGDIVGDQVFHKLTLMHFNWDIHNLLLNINIILVCNVGMSL